MIIESSMQSLLSYKIADDNVSWKKERYSTFIEGPTQKLSFAASLATNKYKLKENSQLGGNTSRKNRWLLNL